MNTNCLSIVQEHDHDRFLLSLMVAAKYRPALWALFAFNYEIAKTREVVSDTTIGLIRLQWWRDAIAEIYANDPLSKPVRRHEVVDELVVAIRTHDLPREDFDNLIYAREFDLEGVVPANLEGFHNYCDFTTTPLYRLAMKICGDEVSESESARLRCESIEYARIGILRSFIFMREQRRIMLPQDIIEKYKLSEQKLLDFSRFENLPEVVKEVFEGEKEFRYDETSSQSKFLKSVKSMNTLYRRQIKAVQYDLFDPKLQIDPPFMALRLWVKSHF